MILEQIEPNFPVRLGLSKTRLWTYQHLKNFESWTEEEYSKLESKKQYLDISEKSKIRHVTRAVDSSLRVKSSEKANFLGTTVG